MKHLLKCRPPLIATLLLAGLLACAKGDTTTVLAECSATYPTGLCAAGQTCSAGACVASASLCSLTSPTGACASGSTCFGGGCVQNTQLCSNIVANGVCALGNTCFQGACVALSSLCTTSNTSGTCPTGQTCQAGSCAASTVDPCTVQVYSTQPTIVAATGASSTPAGILTIGSLKFKDLSKDGKLDPYEDWRLSEICRAKDLVSKLSAPEKIGLMGEGSTLSRNLVAGEAGVTALIATSHLRQALIRLGASPSALAAYLNTIQEQSESQPWGIPFVVTTDPSHGFGMSVDGTTGAQTLSAPVSVSAWPYPLGLGAINDVAVTKQYGDTVRREFMGLGFRWQLGPMADVATEPRWARVQNTFGENAYAVANHTRACIQGFQGSDFGGLRNGIAATMKHFPGAGADQGGKDSHSEPGKYNVFPGNNFEYHQIAFKAAIEAGAAAVMPCYSIFKGQTKYDPEQTGTAFSKGLVTDYLKTTLGFTGMVTSDWGTMSSSIWGVESLTQPQRAAMFIKAGSHQLGSDSISIMQAAYDQGLISDADLNGAATKILEFSFKLGIFENPYVDPTAAAVRTAANRDAGFIAQKKAIVILKNVDHANSKGNKYLPISGSRTVVVNAVTTYLDDTNGNGSVEVYFDGVQDNIVASAAKPDDVNDIYGDYSYIASAATSTLPIVAATSAAAADIAVVRISARKGTYSGLDAGVPLSFDAPFTGEKTDGGLAAALKDRNRVIDLLRIRDGYTKSDGTVVPAANATLKIVLVMHFDRPGIVKPFINGLATLNETAGVPGSYPLVSDPANVLVGTAALKGVDAFLVEFGAFDRAVLDVVFNQHVPTTPATYLYGQSRLPMEIPSTDAEVNAQFEDVPSDTPNPTFALGAGGVF